MDGMKMHNVLSVWKAIDEGADREGNRASEKHWCQRFPTTIVYSM
jgi:hypothetical protein